MEQISALSIGASGDSHGKTHGARGKKGHDAHSLIPQSKKHSAKHAVISNSLRANLEKLLKSEDIQAFLAKISKLESTLKKILVLVKALKAQLESENTPKATKELKLLSAVYSQVSSALRLVVAAKNQLNIAVTEKKNLKGETRRAAPDTVVNAPSGDIGHKGSGPINPYWNVLNAIMMLLEAKYNLETVWSKMTAFITQAQNDVAGQGQTQLNKDMKPINALAGKGDLGNSDAAHLQADVAIYNNDNQKFQQLQQVVKVGVQEAQNVTQSIGQSTQLDNSNASSELSIGSFVAQLLSK